MAVAFVKNVGSALLSMATSGSVTVPAAGVALGNFLVCRAAFDTAAGTVSIADSDGVNVYTVRVNGTTSGGVEAYVFTCPVTDALAAGATITITTDKTSGPFVVDEWSGVGTYEGGDSNTGTSTTPTHTKDPTATAGLVVGVLSSNGGTVTGDADSTGGDTWHELTNALQSSRRTYAAYKIITAGDSQTFDPTFGASQDWVDSILIAAEAATGPTATGALTLPAVTASGTATQTYSATGAVVLPSVVIAGTGAHPYTGTGALTLSAVTTSGAGEEAFTATGAVDLEPIVIAGDGDHTNEKTATGALTLPALTVEGTGEVTYTATGAIDLAAVTVAGSGSEVFTATGALDLSAIAIAGAGTYATAPEATGALTLPAATVAGTGVYTITGTGALDLTGLAIAGVGDTDSPEPEPEPIVGGSRRRRPPQRRIITGTGALILPAAVAAGSGQSFDNDFRLLMAPELVLAGAL